MKVDETSSQPNSDFQVILVVACCLCYRVVRHLTGLSSTHTSQLLRLELFPVETNESRCSRFSLYHTSTRTYFTVLLFVCTHGDRST